MDSTNTLLYFFKANLIQEGERVITFTDLNNGVFGKKKGFVLITNKRVMFYPTGHFNKEVQIPCKAITNLSFEVRKKVDFIKIEFNGQVIEIGTKNQDASLELLNAIEIYRQDKAMPTLPKHKQVILKSMIKLWQGTTLNDEEYYLERERILNCA